MWNGSDDLTPRHDTHVMSMAAGSGRRRRQPIRNRELGCPRTLGCRFGLVLVKKMLDDAVWRETTGGRKSRASEAARLTPTGSEAGRFGTGLCQINGAALT